MKREILFRGKDKATKKWVYGDYTHNEGLNTHYISRNVNNTSRKACMVDPDTIGQYTGLKDKNGNKIFEGDVIESKGYRHIVMYDKNLAGFCSANVKYPEDLCGLNQQWINECDKVVIGNVTDNPELIKKSV